MTKVSMEATYYCKQLIDVNYLRYINEQCVTNTYNYNIQAIDESQDIGDIEYSPTNTIDIHLKEIALEFIETAAEDNKNSESTFISKHILPFARKILLKEPDLKYSM